VELLDIVIDLALLLLMKKFWTPGTVDANSVEMEPKPEARSFAESGGIDNAAFAEDDDEFEMTYARWNLEVIGELEEDILDNNTHIKKKPVESQDSGHDSGSKHYSVTDSEDAVILDNNVHLKKKPVESQDSGHDSKHYSMTDSEDTTNYVTTDFSSYFEDPCYLMKRPDRSVSRLNMIQKLSVEQDRLGPMCQEEDCPYNLWLYRGHRFPEDKVVRNWEVKDKGKDLLDHFSLPRVILSKQTSHRRSPASPSDHKSSKSNSFHNQYSRNPYPFAFPNPTSSMYLPSSTPSQSSGPPTPSTAPLPPYPWHLYNSTTNLSISSDYPVVTLPRSERKKNKKSKSTSSSTSHFTKLCCVKTNRPPVPTPPPIFFMKPKFSARPPSPSSSCSCTSSSCSSCSSCINIPVDPRAPYAFTQDIRRRPIPQKRKCAWLPRCDATCCVITSFILVTMAGLAALLLYLYMFTPVMENTGEM